MCESRSTAAVATRTTCDTRWRLLALAKWAKVRSRARSRRLVARRLRLRSTIPQCCRRRCRSDRDVASSRHPCPTIESADILLAIKEAVDTDTTQAVPADGCREHPYGTKIHDALTCRTENITLWPLAQNEIEGSASNFVDRLSRRPRRPRRARLGEVRGLSTARCYPEHGLPHCWDWRSCSPRHLPSRARRLPVRRSPRRRAHRRASAASRHPVTALTIDGSSSCTLRPDEPASSVSPAATSVTAVTHTEDTRRSTRPALGRSARVSAPAIAVEALFSRRGTTHARLVAWADLATRPLRGTVPGPEIDSSRITNRRSGLRDFKASATVHTATTRRW